MNLFLIISELLYHVRRDIKKLAAIILLIFIAGVTVGFCAGKTVEYSIYKSYQSANKNFDGD